MPMTFRSVCLTDRPPPCVGRPGVSGRHQPRDSRQPGVSVRLFVLPRMEMSRMPDLDRRRFFTAAAASLAASQLGLLAFPGRLQAMTGSIPETVTDGGRQ